MKKSLLFLLIIPLFILSSCMTEKNNNNPAGPDNSKSPVVKLLRPTSGMYLLDEVNVEIEATDDKAVTKVEFYACGELIKTFDAAPYKFLWNVDNFLHVEDTLVHHLWVKAYDADNNCTTTSILDIEYNHYCYDVVVKEGSSSDAFTIKWCSHGNTDRVIIQEALSITPVSYTDIASLPANTVEYKVLNPNINSSHQYRIKSVTSGDISYSQPLVVQYSNGLWH